MIFARKKENDHIWELLIQQLNRLRGEGLWRGSYTQLRRQGVIRIPFEAIDSHPSVPECHIHIGQKLEDCWAEIHPEGTKFSLQDTQLDVDKFLRDLLQVIRQRTYIRTNKDKAEYRNGEV